jgi:hypothetical protein
MYNILWLTLFSIYNYHVIYNYDVNYEYIQNQEQGAILTGHVDIYSVKT